MKLLIFISCCVIAFLAAIVYQSHYLQQHIKTYSIQHAEEKFGSKLVDPEQEQIIRNIAQEMGIVENIYIRKMNYKALQLFGYHNAFAYFPTLWNYIPLSNIPFLFISEGFFEDLLPEEQRFLIGHELIHIQKRHTRYLNLTMLILSLLLLGLAWYVRKYVASMVAQKLSAQYYSVIVGFCTAIIFGISIITPNLMYNSYRRHIEWQADIESLHLLYSYQGGIKLMERWVIEFKLPWYNTYFGLLSDHPSCFERKQYCIEQKNRLEGTILC